MTRWLRWTVVASVLPLALSVGCADRGASAGEDGGDTSEGDDDRGEDDRGEDDEGKDDDGVPDSECGNGVKEFGELCDGEDIGGLSCQDIGWYDGELSCDESCKFDEGECAEPPPGDEPECGNGMKEPGEVCDGDDLGGLTCEDFGMVDGEGGLGCYDGCKLNLEGCRGLDPDQKNPNCGNGKLDPGETCDGGTEGLTCEDLGFEGGELNCDPERCFLDTKLCK